MVDSTPVEKFVSQVVMWPAATRVLREAEKRDPGNEVADETLALVFDILRIQLDAEMILRWPNTVLARAFADAN